MKKSFLALLILLFTLPVFAKNTILIVGDSLSAGYGLERSQGWVILLSQRLKEEGYSYNVINASISGDTTSNGLSRLPPALAKHQPSITIIELGANDGLRGLSLSLIKKNLERMIRLAKQAGSQVLLVGLRLPPNYGPEYIRQFHDLYPALAAQEKVALVPFILAKVDDHPELLQPDRLHPRAEAQRFILENVWEGLKPLLH